MKILLERIKYITILLIGVTYAATVGQLISAEHELTHLKLIQTATVKACGEAWLKEDISDTGVGADIDGKGDWQPVAK